jgi:hypothetical protein
MMVPGHDTGGPWTVTVEHVGRVRSCERGSLAKKQRRTPVRNPLRQSLPARKSVGLKTQFNAVLYRRISL